MPWTLRPTGGRHDPPASRATSGRGLDLDPGDAPDLEHDLEMTGEQGVGDRTPWWTARGVVRPRLVRGELPGAGARPSGTDPGGRSGPSGRAGHGRRGSEPVPAEP